MKHNYLFSVGVLLVSLLLFVACSKKARDPKLIIHVQEKNGPPAASAIIHAWPGQNAGQPGSIINDSVVNQTMIADGFGNATFEFKESAVLDVDVIYYKNYLDTLLNPVTDTLYGHKVVKIEALRQKSEENKSWETVEVQ